MHLKRYQRQTVQDALRAVREDLGPDALVLSTRLIAAFLAVWAFACLPTVLAANSAGCGKTNTLKSGEQTALQMYVVAAAPSASCVPRSTGY